MYGKMISHSLSFQSNFAQPQYESTKLNYKLLTGISHGVMLNELGLEIFTSELDSNRESQILSLVR